ncbi:Asp23/Gls24 family envelope stress response protein [Cellulomonas cellasea]|uniref:Asp23/Gls24 family envelope stress response protein n=1 Tax=Cellulomonas cellasea TaxID=43670 RepID=UPI0025A3B727|nr:Asp23/Gls24 family envelope stress response protein [Cellulomonas cellasea]MDM8084600.1 Asp23/Gls24 family envelope stress response protein [Cellulomonas cellasea]
MADDLAPHGAAPDDTAAAAAADEPGNRGGLRIADSVIARVVEAAALAVDGVAGPEKKAFGRRLPRSQATVAGKHARINLEIATLWPRSAADVAIAVRDRVREQVSTLLDLTADSVGVDVLRVVRPPEPAKARAR